jgi:hypothetical protein
VPQDEILFEYGDICNVLASALLCPRRVSEKRKSGDICNPKNTSLSGMIMIEMMMMMKMVMVMMIMMMMIIIMMMVVTMMR